MPQLIPTQADTPNYSIACTLDGKDYELTFRYSERENCFYLDLALTDGTPLCNGRKLVCYWSIWRIFRYDKRIPQGALMVFPASGASSDPPGILADGTGELGDERRCQLFYITAAELAAMKAAAPA